MEALFWVLIVLQIIVFVYVDWKIKEYEKAIKASGLLYLDVCWKIKKLEKAIKQYMETDKNQVYQENRRLKKQIQDLSDCLDDVQEILDDFKEKDEKTE